MPPTPVAGAYTALKVVDPGVPTDDASKEQMVAKIKVFFQTNLGFQWRRDGEKAVAAGKTFEEIRAILTKGIQKKLNKRSRKLKDDMTETR